MRLLAIVPALGYESNHAGVGVDIQGLGTPPLFSACPDGRLKLDVLLIAEFEEGDVRDLVAACKISGCVSATVEGRPVRKASIGEFQVVVFRHDLHLTHAGSLIVEAGCKVQGQTADQFRAERISLPVRP